MSTCKYVASVDIGTTFIRCHIYDKQGQIIGEAKEPLPIQNPKLGCYEIDPLVLWQDFLNLVKTAIQKSMVSEQELCIGLCTQRNTFTLWNKHTGEPYLNFIVWKDVRAEDIVQSMNNSCSHKALGWISWLLYTVTRAKRFLAASVMKYKNEIVPCRLRWALLNTPGLAEAVEAGDAVYGTIDTWLIYKMTGGRLHVTDASNAAGSGMFDPFIVKWSDVILKMNSIPSSILPKVVDTIGDFSSTEEHLFGTTIPISCVVADQSASMFGACCFDRGDINLTLGTGSFLDINTGSQPHTSFGGIYPLIGWIIDGKVTYMAEGACTDTGSVIAWGQKMGLYNDPALSSSMAESVKVGSICFMQECSRSPAPVDADSGFIGVTSDTQPAEKVKALLESIAFTVKRLYDVMDEEADYPLNNVKVNGGASKNDFLVQLISSITGVVIERYESCEFSSKGTAFLAGLQTGLWGSTTELKQLQRSSHVFKPDERQNQAYNTLFQQWHLAVERFQYLYNESQLLEEAMILLKAEINNL